MKNNLHNDIGDDEIRIITNLQAKQENEEEKKPKRGCIIKILIGLALLILIVLAFIFAFSFRETPRNAGAPKSTPVTAEENVTPMETEQPAQIKGYISALDTLINGLPLTVLTPHYRTTVALQIGEDALNDPEAIMVFQAADIRGDNGKIVGTFVKDGELVSRGESKNGFCAIINGKPIVGAADATPYLEQVIETEGDFFRQYPLVVGGQIVENKPAGKSYRKALAELNEEIVVVLSGEKMTFHDFSQVLVDLGVSNAIYLIGSSAFGFSIDENGDKHEYGKRVEKPDKYVNYIIWK